MRAQCPGEEPARGSEIASSGDEYVDDLAGLVNSSVDVPPPAGDLDVGLVDEPPVADRMPARPPRVREQGVKCWTHRWTVT